MSSTRQGFVCKVCGFISINGSAPERCPVCGAPKTSFEDKEDAIKTPKDPKKLTDFEKKHLPVITVVKKCGLIPEGCQDMQVKVGEITHPMMKEHYILRLDFYIDNEYISLLLTEKLKEVAVPFLFLSVPCL